MRKSKTISISDALDEYRKEMDIDSRLKEIGVLKSWEEIAGKAISRRTKKVYIKKGVLYVHLNSSVVRNELMMSREALIERLNERAGEIVVSEIVLK